MHGVGKFCNFLTEITVYLRNGTRYTYDYYGTLIGNHHYLHWFIDVCDGTVMLCLFFLLALLCSVCVSFIVHIVSYVDIGGQH